METNTKPLSKNPVSIALLIAWAPDLLHPLRLRRQPLRTFSGHLGKGRQALAESSKELRGFGLRHRWREPIPVLIILSPFCLSPISRKTAVIGLPAHKSNASKELRTLSASRSVGVTQRVDGRGWRRPQSTQVGHISHESHDHASSSSSDARPCYQYTS